MNETMKATRLISYATAKRSGEGKIEAGFQDIKGNEGMASSVYDNMCWCKTM